MRPPGVSGSYLCPHLWGHPVLGGSIVSGDSDEGSPDGDGAGGLLRGTVLEDLGGTTPVVSYRGQS